MITATVTTNGIRDLELLWSRAPEVMREEMLTAVAQATALMQRETQELTPVGVGAGGGLKGSIFGSEDVLADNVIGIVATSVPHAIPVELGTKPHFPPVDALIDWVERKLGVPPEQSQSVAFLVARKIAAKGTEGAFMFRRAFEANVPQVTVMFDEAVTRATERLA